MWPGLGLKVATGLREDQKCRGMMGVLCAPPSGSGDVSIIGVGKLLKPVMVLGVIVGKHGVASPPDLSAWPG